MSNITLTSNENQSPFDSIRRFDEQGNEFWMARELMKLLGYKEWRKFHGVIERVERSINLQGQDSQDHIVRSDKLGKAGKEIVNDSTLTRYACYLIAMSGDNSKPEIAQAQSYFATKTRQAEIAQPQLQQHIDKEIKLQQLKSEYAKLLGDLTTMHGIELAMPAAGATDQVVRIETVVTEVVQPETGRRDKILSADQLKRAIADRTGQKPKTMKEIVNKIKAAGRDDLLLPVTRHSTTEYVDADRLDEALALVYGQCKQELLKPNSLLARR
jgi:hypothetical protein